MPAVSDFWQVQPDEGQPASERTEVRIIFTADTLYVGVVCYDREPSGIIVSDSRRDSSLTNTDSFRMILDTYRDRQNGFVFGTNPAGIEYDGQVTNEGQGGGGASGDADAIGLRRRLQHQLGRRLAGAGEDHRRGVGGRVRDPVQDPALPAGADQVWGVNFQRNIRRRNERAFWAPIPRQFNLYRVSLAGTMSGHQGAACCGTSRSRPTRSANALESGSTPPTA